MFLRILDVMCPSKPVTGPTAGHVSASSQGNLTDRDPENSLKGFHVLEHPKTVTWLLPDASGALEGTRGAVQNGAHDLGEVYRQHVQQVARWVTRLGGPRVEVEDVVQEIFLIVAAKLSSFRGHSKLETWLYGIAENVLRQRRRKEKLRRLFAVSSRESSAGVEAEAAGPLAPELLEKAQASHAVYRVLDQLNDKHRTVLVLFELEGLKGEQVAELLGIQLNAVWVRLHRARKAFIEKHQALEREEAR
jgi:RNA polymerase sigma-70 factor, ECF subfamily